MRPWTPSAIDKAYWEERTDRLGASAGGYSDPAMDAYEDRLRDEAIKRMVGAGRGRRLLDVGCGTGRWSTRLAGAGWLVTGVDLSERMIALAPRVENVAYVVSAVQDLRAPDESFDAWLSVTALQHITSDDDFASALANLTRMLKPGGQAAVLEYAPLWRVGHSRPYLRQRGRREWIQALNAFGYRLRDETGVRFLGYAPYMVGVTAARALGRPASRLRGLRALCAAADLGLARIPVATLTADVRLMLFDKPQL